MNGELDTSNMPADLLLPDDGTKPEDQDFSTQNPVTGRLDGEKEAVKKFIDPLAVFVMSSFEAACQHRDNCGISEELRQCAYQYRGEYTPEELSVIMADNVAARYHNISEAKCRGGVSWVSDIFLNTREKPWTTKPTPISELMDAKLQERIIEKAIDDWKRDISPEPPQTPEEKDALQAYAKLSCDFVRDAIQKEAEKRAKRMDKVIHDQTIEGGWRGEMRKAINYGAIYGTLLLKGPFPKIKTLPVNSANKLGVIKPKLERKRILSYEAIDPNDIYPSKGATSVNEGILCQRVSYRPEELWELAEEPGYVRSVIDEVLALYASVGFTIEDSIDQENRELMRRGSGSGDTSLIEGVEFWGVVRGSMLIQRGIDKDPTGNALSERDFYDINAIVIANRVVYCNLIDKTLGRPLFKATFYEVAGSWWGDGVLKKMRDIQKTANASVRTLIKNMAIASGPLVVYTDVKRLADPSDTTVTPWKAIKCINPRNMSDVPVKFEQPQDRHEAMLNIITYFTKEADLITGIPQYSQGNAAQGGAGRTASGLEMLLSAAERGIRHVVYSIDEDMMRPLLTYLYHYNLMYNNNPSIKGDMMVDASGLLGIIRQDQNIDRAAQLLQLAMQQPIQEVVGQKGTAELLRRQLELIDGDPSRIIPSPEVLEARDRLANLVRQRNQELLAQAGTGGMEDPTGAMADPRTIQQNQLAEMLGGSGAQTGALPSPSTAGTGL